ncbi:uncharacterized protein B0H64DRAFT_148272, partial [Chaetomium fimeti]
MNACLPTTAWIEKEREGGNTRLYKPCVISQLRRIKCNVSFVWLLAYGMLLSRNQKQNRFKTRAIGNSGIRTRLHALHQSSWASQTRHSPSADTRGDVRLRHSPRRSHAGLPVLLTAGSESLPTSNPSTCPPILPSPNPNSTSLTNGGGANLTRRDTSVMPLPSFCNTHATRLPALSTPSATQSSPPSPSHSPPP